MAIADGVPKNHYVRNFDFSEILNFSGFFEFWILKKCFYLELFLGPDERALYDGENEI